MKYAILFLLFASTVHAAVVRPAPDVTFPGPAHAQSLRGLRGQPVVLIIADSPKAKPLKKQLVWLRDLYQTFASRKAVFIAAFKNSNGGAVQSNIPFALANNPQAVAAAYGVTGDFALIIIGKDGNVDYETTKPQTPERIRDVMQNSFEVQSSSRRSVSGPTAPPKTPGAQ